MTTLSSFPMVHPTTFRQNPLIDYLSNDPYWTVSDNKKRPVNARLLLDAGEIYNAKFDGEWPLTSLLSLDQDSNLDAVNRAYRLRARENRVIAIDVEPSAPESMKQEVMDFPAHYTELSKNGGVHLLIQVPEDLIHDDNRYMLEDLSVFKEPVPKAENPEEKPRDAHFEVLFNDHFVTFTKRMLTEKSCVDYTFQQEARKKLARFLDQIVDMDKERKKEREIAKQYRIGLMKNIVDDDTDQRIRKFLSIEPFEAVKEQAKSKNASDFGGDESRYEMSVASGIASQIIRIHKLAKDTISFREMALSFTEQHLAYAVYLMLQEAVPYRDKHGETRDSLPWLLFTAKKAYEFVKAQNAKRAKK